MKSNLRRHKNVKLGLLFGFGFGVMAFVIGVWQLLAAQVGFLFTPTAQDANPGQTKVVVMSLQTGGQQITGGKVKVTFDNSLLSFEGYTEPPGWLRTDIDNKQAGSSSYTFEFEPHRGRDSIAEIDLGSIKFKAKNTVGTKVAQIKFDMSSTNAYKEGSKLNKDYYPVLANGSVITVHGTQSPPKPENKPDPPKPDSKPKTPKQPDSKPKTTTPETPLADSSNQPEPDPPQAADLEADENAALAYTNSQNAAFDIGFGSSEGSKDSSLLIATGGFLASFTALLLYTIFFKHRPKKPPKVDPDTKPINRANMANPLLSSKGSRNINTMHSKPLLGEPGEPYTVPKAEKVTAATLKNIQEHAGKPNLRLEAKSSAVSGAISPPPKPVSLTEMVRANNKTASSAKDTPDMFDLANDYPESYGSESLLEEETGGRKPKPKS